MWDIKKFIRFFVVFEEFMIKLRREINIYEVIKI